jgi:hypothetical protein
LWRKFAGRQGDTKDPKGTIDWYRNPHGRVFAITPWRLVEYRKMTPTFNAEEYEMR